MEGQNQNGSTLTLEQFLGTPQVEETNSQNDELGKFLGEVETEQETSETETTDNIVTETEVEQPEKKEEVQQSFNGDFYSDLVKDYIEEGDWEDVILEMDGEEVQLSTLTNISKEKFQQIKQAQKELQKQKLEENYISVEGLDDTTKKLIEIKKQNGDIRGLIQYEAEAVHPLKNFDLENPSIQEGLIKWELTNRGEDPEDIEYKINKYKKNFTLDVEAEKIVKKIDAEYNAEVERQLEQKKAENLRIQEEQKAYRKSMSDIVKGYKIKENLAKSVIDSATKYDQNGLTEADRLFFEAKANPEMFSQIVFMLKHPKEFEDFKGVKNKNENALKTIKIISTIDKKATNATVEKQDDSAGAWSDFAKKNNNK